MKSDHSIKPRTSSLFMNLSWGLASSSMPFQLAPPYSLQLMRFSSPPQASLILCIFSVWPWSTSLRLGLHHLPVSRNDINIHCVLSDALVIVYERKDLCDLSPSLALRISLWSCSVYIYQTPELYRVLRPTFSESCFADSSVSTLGYPQSSSQRFPSRPFVYSCLPIPHSRYRAPTCRCNPSADRGLPSIPDSLVRIRTKRAPETSGRRTGLTISNISVDSRTSPIIQSDTLLMLQFSSRDDGR